jgi:RHS repeat-associated protein
VIPHTNWQGEMDIGTFDSGGVVGNIGTAGTYCRTPAGQGTVCMVVDWAAGFQGVFNEYHAPYGPRSWFGSLTFNKQDASGLQYARNRYYDPSTGRFMQEDPLGIGGGLNTYGFAGGDPINYSDPFGLCVEDLCIGEVGGGTLAVVGVATTTAIIALVDGKPLARAIDEGVAAGQGVITWVVDKVKGKGKNSGKTSPGQTAGGKATDEYGNAIGPSGRIQVNAPRFPTKKGAKDAARRVGKRAPVNDPSPEVGDPHFHPTDANGKKIPGSTHFGYPE